MRRDEPPWSASNSRAGSFERAEAERQRGLAPVTTNDESFEVAEANRMQALASEHPPSDGSFERAQTLIVCSADGRLPVADKQWAIDRRLSEPTVCNHRTASWPEGGTVVVLTRRLAVLGTPRLILHQADLTVDAFTS